MFGPEVSTVFEICSFRFLPFNGDPKITQIETIGPKNSKFTINAQKLKFPVRTFRPNENVASEN